MIWMVGYLLAVASPASADPVIVDAMRKYGDCFREHALESKQKLYRRKTREVAYADAKAACADSRVATAQIVRERWDARGEPAKDPAAIEKYLDYFLEGERYQIDAENMASFKD